MSQTSRQTMTASVEIPKKILVIDVGGTHVKVRVTGQDEERKIDSGPSMTALQMVRAVKRLAKDWTFDAISIGYPGPVIHSRPMQEPHNLGAGWVGFDFDKAFGHPVKLINDAAMQALGSYDGGRMLFLGLGTGLGTAMVVGGVVEPMELGHLPFKHRTYEDYMGERGRKEFGKKEWQAHVLEGVEALSAALEPDYIILGGGNASKL